MTVPRSQESSPDELHTLIKTAPDVAWPLVVAFVHAHPESSAAQDLIEDFLYEHDERFIGRLEAAALADPVMRSVVDQAYVGGVATVGAERFQALQRRLRSAADKSGRRADDV